MNFISKIAILSLIFITINAEIILKNGISASTAKVKRIYSLLKKLDGQTDNKLFLERLYQACNTDLQFKVREYDWNNMLSECGENELAKTILFAESLDLCDKNGKIENETAEIIKCSLELKALYRDSGSFSRKMYGTQIIVSSPIGWKTYFTKKYWFSKE